MLGKHRKCPWSEAAGEALDRLMKQRRTTPEKLARSNSEVTAHGIRNWFWSDKKRRICPSEAKLSIVRELLNVKANYFDSFIEGGTVLTAHVQHPHGALG